MLRTPRTDIGGLAYHVLNRANCRAPLFDDQVDYRSFTELLADERAHIGMRLLAWCLMPNHWHLVLWTRDDGDLSRFVRRLTACDRPGAINYPMTPEVAGCRSAATDPCQPLRLIVEAVRHFPVVLECANRGSCENRHRYTV